MALAETIFVDKCEVVSAASTYCAGNEKVIKFYFDNQLIKNESAVSGRVKYNVDSNGSAFSVADNTDASNPTKAGGLVPFFGISNASTGQPIQADIDYVYYSIEKNEGEI